MLEWAGCVAGELGMSASVVGGCVRDWLLGLEDALDLDVTVEGDGVAVALAIAERLGGTVTVHQPFRTATVILRHTLARPSRAPGRAAHSPQHTGASRLVRIDFATCRKETYGRPAAYPKVSPGTLEEDLRRRDFTINAMAIALSPGALGAVVDPFGGLRDLRGKRLRALHRNSFVDDPSRILRGVRFAARFGLQWDARTGRAARQAVAAGALGWLNAGRVRKELGFMRQEPDPRACAERLARLLGLPASRSMRAGELIAACERRIAAARAAQPRAS